MKKIFKYQITKELSTTNEIEMPKDAIIIKVGLQAANTLNQKRLTFWAIVNPDNLMETRTFKVIGTGWEVPENEGHYYIDTVFDNGFVWHIFEIF